MFDLLYVAFGPVNNSAVVQTLHHHHRPPSSQVSPSAVLFIHVAFFFLIRDLNSKMFLVVKVKLQVCFHMSTNSPLIHTQWLKEVLWWNVWKSPNTANSLLLFVSCKKPKDTNFPQNVGERCRKGHLLWKSRVQEVKKSEISAYFSSFLLNFTFQVLKYYISVIFFYFYTLSRRLKVESL